MAKKSPQGFDEFFAKFHAERMAKQARADAQEMGPPSGGAEWFDRDLIRAWNWRDPRQDVGQLRARIASGELTPAQATFLLYPRRRDAYERGQIDIDGRVREAERIRKLADREAGRLHPSELPAPFEMDETAGPEASPAEDVGPAAAPPVPAAGNGQGGY
jgi:hypothetical protein